MRFVPTIVHGVADYFVGLVVVALPFYFGWTGLARASFLTLGLFVTFYSLSTDYELGLIRFLRIRFHLLLDAVFGFGMLIVPTLLGLPLKEAIIVYVFGALALFLTLTTKIRAQGTHTEIRRTT